MQISQGSRCTSFLLPSYRAVTVVVTVSISVAVVVLTLTLPVTCEVANAVTGMIVSAPVTEVAVAPPDEIGVTGGRGAVAVAAAGEDGVGVAGVDGSDDAAAASELEEVGDWVDVALAIVTKAVDTVETVTVVVGSSVGTALLEGTEDGLASADDDVAAAGTADVASEIEVLEVVRAGSGAELASVCAAAAPVIVVKPAVAPVKVADMVTKTTDAALVGSCPAAGSEEVDEL